MCIQHWLSSVIIRQVALSVPPGMSTNVDGLGRS
jgi:hypothetical protein